MPSKISIDKVIDKLELAELQKDIMKERFVNLIINTRTRASRVSIIYHAGHVIVTVGSLFVPALLSIQYSGMGSSQGQQSQNTFSTNIYWTTWVISVLVTIFNGVLTLFKVDKKYLYLHTNLERLESEGWQYAELSGRYSGFNTPGEKATHTNQFIFFCHKIEKIRMQQIDDEFHPIAEPTNTNTNTVVASQEDKKLDSIIPPTPLNPLQITKNVLGTIEEEAGSDKNTMVNVGGNNA